MKGITLALLLLITNLAHGDTVEGFFDYNRVVKNSDSVSSVDLDRFYIATNSKIYSFVKVNNDIHADNAEVLSVIDKETNSGKVVELLKNTHRRNYKGIILKGDLLYLFIRKGRFPSGTIEVWTVDTISDAAKRIHTVDISTVRELGQSGLLELFVINDDELIFKPGSSFIAYNTSTNIFRTETMLPLLFVSNSFALNNSIVFSDSERLYRADTATGSYEPFMNESGAIRYLGIFNNRGYFLQNTQQQSADGCCDIYNLLSTDGHSLRLEFESVFLGTGAFETKIQQIGNKLFYMQEFGEKKLLFKTLNEPEFSSVSSDFSFAGHPLYGSDLTEYNGKYYLLGSIYEADTNTNFRTIIEIDLLDGFKQIAKQEKTVEGDTWIYLFNEGSQLSLIEEVSFQNGSAPNNPLLTNCYSVDLTNNVVNRTGQISNFRFDTKIEKLSQEYVYAKSADFGIEPRKLSCLTHSSFLIQDFNKYLKNADADFTYKSSPKYSLALYKGIFDFTEKLFLLEDSATEYDTSAIQSNYFGFRARFISIDNDYLYLHIYLHEEYDLGLGADLGSYFPFALNLKTGEAKFLGIGFASNVKFYHGHFIGSVPNYDSSGRKGTRLYRLSVNKESETVIPLNFTNFIPFKDYFLVYGLSEDQVSYEFTKLDKNILGDQFSISCEETCREEPLVENVNNAMLISTADSEVLGDFYLYHSESGKAPVKIASGYSGDVVLVTNRGNYSLLNIYNNEQGSNDVGKHLYSFNHSDDSLTKIYSNFGNHIEIKSVGNYFIGVTEDKKLLVFDDKFSFINQVEVPNPALYESLSEDNYFDCDNGSCYLTLNKSSDNAGVSDLIKFNSRLDILETISLDVHIYSTIKKNSSRILLDAKSESWGREIFALNREVSDSDMDGMDDNYEVAFDLDPNDSGDASLDFDNDGVSNVDEYILGLNPSELDTDSDGYIDGEEIAAGYNPLEYDLHLNDSDSDGVVDSDDLFPLDPTESSDNDADGIGDNADTDDDNDGVVDSEDLFPLDPTESSDNDADGIGDNADTDDDNDGMPDDWEIQYGLDPLLNSDRNTDLDNDGVSNYGEYRAGTNPTVANSSGGGTTNSPSSGGGGGSTSLLMLFIMLAYAARRYYR